MNVKIKLIKDFAPIPWKLLELADPSQAQINCYLKQGSCYIAQLAESTVGAMVLIPINPQILEVKNIAVHEDYQGKGIGKQLLHFATSTAQTSGYSKLRIGTGNSSIGQLALYQKMGFEITDIDYGFFIKNYDEPIFENGIHCKHMIILEKNIN